MSMDSFIKAATKTNVLRWGFGLGVLGCAMMFMTLEWSVSFAGPLAFLDFSFGFSTLSYLAIENILIVDKGLELTEVWRKVLIYGTCFLTPLLAMFLVAHFKDQKARFIAAVAYFVLDRSLAFFLLAAFSAF